MSKLIYQDNNLFKGGDSLKRLSARINKFVATWAGKHYSVVARLTYLLTVQTLHVAVYVCVNKQQHTESVIHARTRYSVHPSHGLTRDRRPNFVCLLLNQIYTYTICYEQDTKPL